MADIDRNDAAGLLSDQEFNEVLQDATKQSAALSSFRTVRMSTKVGQMPVLTALPVASWVSGDSGRKSTTQLTWEKKQITAEELAAIVLIPDALIDDTNVPIWGEVRPRLAEAIAVAIDEAVFFGTNAPASFDDSLFEGADGAGQTYAEGTSAVDLAEDINQTWGIVEDLGLDVNVQYASRSLRRRLRGLRDENNQPIYLETLRGDQNTRELMGSDILYVSNGAWDDDTATMIVGDRSKAIIGIRQDITYTLSQNAVITDGSGNVVVSAFEQDMTAMRVVFRCGFVVGEVYTREAGDQVWPFAALTPAS